MSEGFSVLLICSLWLFICIIIMGIMYYVIDRQQRKKKFMEYEYPGRRMKKNKKRLSEIVIASFKDLAIDDKKHQCYKLLITQDKVYLIQYFQDSDQMTSGYPGVGSLILEFLINILFKKQLRNIARSLDKGRLEKSNSIPKLLERTNFFYEIDRSMVSLKISNQSLRIKHKGYYRYGRKGKGPDDNLNSMMSLNNVELYFDSEYYKEYNKLVSTFFQD